MPYKDKSVLKIYQAEYRRKNRNSRSLAGCAWSLKKRYGLTPEDKLRMCEEQGGKCAICTKPFESPTAAHVDHNHATGQVRKLLCKKCNTAFGMLDENPIVIQNLLDYAREFS